MATILLAAALRDDAALFAKEALGLSLDAKQHETLGGSGRRVILNCSRQWGKSTMAAAKAVHQMISRARSLVVVLGPSEKQSGETVRKIEAMLGKLGLQCTGDGANAISAVIENGSRVVGLPGSEKTGRGLSAVNLLIVEEAARVPDATYLALRPVVATSNGDIWLLSTPNGKTGFFWETWSKGGVGWRRVMAPATECPRISKAFLDEERAQMREAFFRQEYMCEFGEAGGAFFREGDIEAMFPE